MTQDTNPPNPLYQGGRVPEEVSQALVGETVNDVYLYDTRKDSIDSSWRSDVTKSWHTETIDATYADCDFAVDDRCGKASFPKKALIVAAD